MLLFKDENRQAKCWEEQMAKSEVTDRLEQHRADFASVTGAPFSHFFCPVLHVDEDTELCQGHIICQAFDTPRV